MLFRDYRPIDCGPGPGRDVPSRVHICVVCVPTGHAAELCLRWAVGFVDMTAGRAFSACVVRIDEREHDTSPLRFVLNESAKLMERPAAHLRSLRLAKPCPVADALEILKGKSTSGAFGLGNERFGNAMVDLLAKACFPTCHLGEFAPDGFWAKTSAFAPRCGLLQGAAQFVGSNPASLDSLTAVPFPVTVGGKILHAEIDTNKVCDGQLGPVRQVNGHE